MIGKDVPVETKRASRIPTGILLIAFTFVPFFWDDCVILILVTAVLGIFEGYVHLMAIRLFRLPKFYSPGLVTAELELLVSIALIVWLEQNNLTSATDYIWGVVIMFACFINKNIINILYLYMSSIILGGFLYLLNLSKKFI